MNNNKVDLTISGLFKAIWGYSSPAFELDRVTGNTTRSRQETGNAAGSDYYGYDAISGQEYFLPITVTYPVDITNSGAFADGAVSSSLKTWDLPHPIISVASKKTIIETPMTERRGTVKELINVEEYMIVVKGIIIGESNEFPEADVAILRELYECEVAVSIQNPITDIFLMRPGRSGSDKVVIRELHFPEVKGVKNVRPYELVMTSDEPFNLIEIVK